MVYVCQYGNGTIRADMMSDVRRIAFYGKGGIGKSTTVSNIAAALAERGLRVMQIGCDPKSDSTISHTANKSIPTVLNVMSEKKGDITLEDIVFEGTDGVLCVEAGGPKPGFGCAGRGIITALEELDRLDAVSVYKPDFIFYDVLGDVVCGGFALPIRKGYADSVYVITSGERMALFAANNICQSVRNSSDRGYASGKGLILNKRNVKNEDEVVAKAAEDIGTKVVCTIPRSDDIQSAEEAGCTVMAYAPDSEIAGKYRELADIIRG